MSAVVLDPGVQSFLDRAAEAGLLPYAPCDPERRRDVVARLQQAAPPAADRIAIDGGACFLRRVPAPDAAPILLYLHGGFWSFGGWDTHGAAASALAKSCGAGLLFVDYGLTSGTSPAQALKQARAAFAWAADQGRPMAIAGDGSGGAMAAMLAAAPPPDADIRLLLLFHPVTGDCSAASGVSPWLDGAAFTRLATEILGVDGWAGLSPLGLSLEKLRRLPPALIVTADGDPAGPGGEALARRLMLAEIECSAVRLLGTIHDFFWLDALADTAPTQTAQTLARQALRAAFAR